MKIKNHFFFAYAGNKRNEFSILYENIKDNLDNIEYVVEPFCGSSAISYNLSLLHPKKFKYILNDNDENLIKLYNIAKDETQLKKLEEDVNKIAKIIDKEKYNLLMKEKTFISYMIGQLIHTLRPKLYNLKYNYNYIDLNNKPIINFLRNENVEIKNIDGLELIKEKLNNQNYLFIIDPPYIASCNEFYKSKTCNIYEYFYNNDMKEMKSKIVFMLEENWIIKLLFQKYNLISYGKKYEVSKKNTTHLIIKNF